MRKTPVVVITVVLGLKTSDISSWTKLSGRDVLLYEEATEYRTDLLYYVRVRAVPSLEARRQA